MTNNKNMMDTIIDAQKNMVDTLVDNTSKWTGGNNVASETINKNTQLYKDWLAKQKETYENVNEKMNTSSEKNQDSMKQAQTYFQNWMEGQMKSAQDFMNKGTEQMKNTMGQTNNSNTNTNNNPWGFNMPNMNSMGNMGNMNNMGQNWMNAMQQMNNWNKQQNMMTEFSNMMQQYNPMNMMNKSQNMMTDMPAMVQQFMDLTSSTFSDLQNNMSNGTTKDTFSNMINSASSFGKFYEMWAPYWKQIQDKSFNADYFKSTFNAETYKEFVDKMFGFMPEEARTYMNNMQSQMTEALKGMMNQSKDATHQMRDAMKSMNIMSQHDMYGQMMEQYTKAHHMFNQSVAPIGKMIAPNKYTKGIQAWSEIMDRTNIYQIKNSQLQYMMYEQGMKVMEKLADNVSSKMENGEEVKSMTALYQEWLNISDSVYVELFESEEYCKLMAETSAMQLKIKKDVDMQMEQSLSSVPVATRSELDELYKIIYDLKKEVRNMEKSIKTNGKANAASPTHEAHAHTSESHDPIAKATNTFATKNTEAKPPVNTVKPNPVATKPMNTENKGTKNTTKK